MTGLEIKNLSESILDNNVDWTDEFYYQLLNIAKTKLEGSRLWQYLKKLYDSNTVASGNNYSTGIVLPDDFAVDYKVEVGLNTEYFPVSFEDQHIYRNSSLRYYIDHSTETIHILGNTPGGILYLFYKRFTPNITSTTSPVFPERFHPILAFMVSGYFQSGVDSDDIFARMSPENKLAALELQRSMNSWDTELAMRAQNSRIGMESGGPKDVDVSAM